MSLRKKLLKLLVFYVAMHLLFVGIHWLSQKPIFNLISLEHLITSDASLNDLHYPLRRQQEADPPSLTGKVILINTGSLPKDSFRQGLAQTLNRIAAFNPKVIGVDHDFNPDTSIQGTQELIDALQRTPQLILASKTTMPYTPLPLSAPIQYGNVEFPDHQSTIRRYSSDTAAFAFRIAQHLTQFPLKKPANKTFVINYLTGADGYFTPNSDFYLFYAAAPEEKQSSFLMLEAGDILKRDSLTLDALRLLAPGRALILGHLGNPNLFNRSNDIEDKHRVPVDTNLINRERTMDGVLIHANVIENLLTPTNRFLTISDSWLFALLKQILILLFLYYLLFCSLGKAINILLLTLLSFPLIYFVLYLMNRNIYLEIGLTLLQFMILEEVVEVFESIHHLYSKAKLKWLKS